ncbi:6-phosphogluconolactonase [Sphingomonas oleivorans]|uniref:6-phosphogluconolactonase n=1 Tax=Sphingomonas oleivorans TaxID=1735121 RepID=A0A2T5FXL5_9SPHN|nr:6-phosphogluconolactonase [Sphingomonas oleivorans]PTQ10871.1 6-phosphogluconolactonase [Sphingomonas oleivorans]
MTDIVWAAHADAEAVADRIASVLSRPGPRSIAVPGGRTPIPIFDLLRRQPLPWGKATVTLTDDRIVPHDHPASNFGLLSQALDATPAHLVPLSEGMALSRFDLVWLGMGADGHIASIFPGSNLPESPATVLRTLPDPLPPEAPFERLTLSQSALLDTDELILVLRGADKRAVLEAAIAGENDLPIARLIRAATSPITIFWSRT